MPRASRIRQTGSKPAPARAKHLDTTAMISAQDERLRQKVNREQADEEQAEQAQLAADAQKFQEEDAAFARDAKIDLFKLISEQPEVFPLEVANYNILCEMVTPRSMMGRFFKTALQQENEQYLTVIGRVLLIGPTAFDGTTKSGIVLSNLSATVKSPADLLGKYVQMQRYTGNDVYFAPMSSKKLRYITIGEILGITTVPSMFMKQ